MSWSVGKLTLALYPFGAGAMAVNTFLASLAGTWVGLPVLSTGTSILIGCIIGIPVTYWFARYIRALVEKAE